MSSSITQRSQKLIFTHVTRFLLGVLHVSDGVSPFRKERQRTVRSLGYIYICQQPAPLHTNTTDRAEIASFLAFCKKCIRLHFSVVFSRRARRKWSADFDWAARLQLVWFIEVLPTEIGFRLLLLTCFVANTRV